MLNNILDNVLNRHAVSFTYFLLLSFLFILARRVILFYLRKVAEKTTTDFDDFIVSLLGKINLLSLIVLALFITSLVVEFGESFRIVANRLFVVVGTFQAIILLQEVVKYFIAKLYVKKTNPGDLASKAMARSINGILRWVIWSLGLVFLLDNLGVNISALVAGIGIGGIAVAMASQAVLSDAFSAFSIFLDKPFEVGDFIIIDDYPGTVEHIGIKTTRIRSLYGEQLILSNSDLTKGRIKNYKRMETRRVAFRIGVVYKTPLEKIKKIPAIISGIFSSIDGIRLDRVHFASFGDFSLTYEIVYYVLSADYNIYMDKQQAINLKIMESFEAEKIEFAYPTQTLYVQK